MTGRILGQKARVGKRWPYRALNFLPPAQLWRYLAWKSDPGVPPPVFDVSGTLAGARRILVILPEDTRELLVALPLVQAHFKSLPEAAIWLLSGVREAGFLGGIFGRERVLALDPDGFFLGEEHFQELLQRIEGMRPDLVVNLREWSPPLLHFLVRKSQAPLRVQLAPGPEGYANITLAAGDPPNHLRRFQLVARLWDSAGVPLSGKWSRIVPPPEAMARALEAFSGAGLDPARTLLLPWQDTPREVQERLAHALAARESRSPAPRRIALVQGRDPLFASPEPPPLAGFPVLSADSAPVLLALFATAAGTEGLPGPLLLLAGLADADVTAWHGPGDGPFDTSAGNARMRVEDLGGLRE